jgi:hypothetical protein
MENTPNYNRRLTVTFGSDKNGRPLAYYWSNAYSVGMQGMGLGRWIRVKLDDAKLWVAQGLADEYREVAA